MHLAGIRLEVLRKALSNATVCMGSVIVSPEQRGFKSWFAMRELECWVDSLNLGRDFLLFSFFHQIPLDAHLETYFDPYVGAISYEWVFPCGLGDRVRETIPLHNIWHGSSKSLSEPYYQ
jgi:hypothetical protein